MIGTLLILALVALLVFYFFFNDGADYKIEKVIPSPLNKFTATHFTASKSTAGWCSQVISVNTDEEPFSIELEKESRKNEVFRADCSANVHVQWLSETRLRIDFSSNSNSERLSLSMTETDKTGVIKIEYGVIPSKAIHPTP